MHASDKRWGDLRDAVETIEAVLKELGSFKPWVPPNVKAPERIQYRGTRRRLSPGRRVNWRVELEGGEAEFSVEPSLPPNLELNTQGFIVGTLQPGNSHPETTYTVVAKNASGQCSTELSFSVADMPPKSVAYGTSKDEIRVGEVVTWEPSVEGGTPSEWSVTPELPAGLVLNPATGVIRGSAVEVSEFETYVVFAGNTGGKVDGKLQFLVSAAKPTSLVYPFFTEAMMLPMGVFLEAFPEAVVGLRYSVDPPLPDGINLDEVTGIISGAPVVDVELALYKVAASNISGQVSTSLRFGVQLTKPESIEYPEIGSRLFLGYPVDLVPTVTGGRGEFSSSPELPTGLVLDKTSGVINGSPAVTVESNSWTVTMRNSAGQASCKLNFGIEPAPPSSLEYPGLPEVFSLNTAVTVISLVNGEVDEYVVSPTLPVGLNLDAVTGRITGAPRELAEPRKYKVVARNASGETSTDIQFAVRLLPPTDLQYPTFGKVLVAGDAQKAEPQVTGGATSFTVSPMLPKGLRVDVKTGTIKGTAVGAVDEATYTIRASNEAGFTETDVTFSVVVPPPENLLYPGCSGLFAVEEVVRVEPQVEGCTLGCTYTVTPVLPEGLVLDPKTGVISGSPVEVDDEQQYTITVANASGSTSVDITLQVAEALAFEEVVESIDKQFAAKIEEVTDLSEMLEEPCKVKTFGNWMIWMVHRAKLNDPDLVDFNFNNRQMPPPHVESRIAPKLMEAMKLNTHITSLSLNNSNLVKAQVFQLAEALEVNSTLRVLTLESNNLDSTALTRLAKAVMTNSNSSLEQLRLSQFTAAGALGRPAEEAIGQMMEKNETIIKLGFECNDTHWRNIIDRALLRNTDYHRRRKFGGKNVEEDLVVEEKTLSRVVLQQAPKTTADKVFAEASEHSSVFRSFVARQRRLPTGSQLQSYARNEGTPIKYSTVAPLIKECRSRILDAVVDTTVVIRDTFEVDSDGKLLKWSEETNNNWVFEVRADDKRIAYKTSKEPAFLVSDDVAAWVSGGKA
eukprot:TRINITY_DN36141_c0_g1_i1.p1 TRINITY_DN36141_c0_g1~~TRINITY_DN36141_c0_g1_i1.p1  ORF type:complete len:1188 (+),score=237.35 TRINITY_DN36141_c0_g1_i1:511-3564(+)